MSTPAWILGIFAAVMLLIAEVAAGQLLLGRAWTRRGGAGIAVSQLLTGIATAGILVPRLSVLPNAAWEVVFAVMTAWFAWCLWWESRGRGVAGLAGGHCAPPLVHSAAMLYLFAALAAPSAGGPGPSMSGMGWTSGGASLHAPTLALIFALLLLACTVRDLDRRAGSALVAGPAGAGTAGVAERLLFSPAVVKGCRVATGVTMAFTLIVMI